MSQNGKTTGSIAGRVVAGEVPVKDAVVMITGDSPPHEDIAALTDTDGRFRFDDLLPGEYVLMVNAIDRIVHTGAITVDSGGESRVVVEIPF